jgi:carbon storage regulator CsrA
MLVLSRKPSEVIVIELEDGRKIRLVAVRIADNVVRLGIDAPRSMNIYRQELHPEEVFSGSMDSGSVPSSPAGVRDGE